MTAVLTVIIADDEIPLRGLLRTLIDRDGRCSVVAEASDGAEALELVDQFDPDVLVLDLGMPRMDGLEVLAALEGRQRPRVVVLTGYADESTTRQAIDMGAVACLVKGRDFAVLVDRLVGH